MSSGIHNARRYLSKENPFYLAMLGVVLLSPLLAYGLPEDALTRWPWLKNFTDIMAGLIPSIERLTELSKFPEVTRLFMSLQWVVWGPICIWLLLKFGRPTEENMTNALRMADARWWYVFFLPPLGVVVAWFFVSFPFSGIGRRTTPFDYIVQWMSESRLWLGMLGSLFVTLTALVVVGVLRSHSLIRLAYRVRQSSPYFRKRKEHLNDH